MNTSKTFLAIALFIPALSWAGEKIPSACTSNCTSLVQRLEKLDCGTTIAEAAKFLSDGRTLVETVPRRAYHMQNEIANLRRGLQSREQTLLDCSNKHRDKKDLLGAMSAFSKADLAVKHLSESPEIPRHVQEMLVRDYDQSVKTVSEVSSKWQK
jgi:hypothetical protein